MILAKFLEGQEYNFVVVVYNFPFTVITQTVLIDGLFFLRPSVLLWQQPVTLPGLTKFQSVKSSSLHSIFNGQCSDSLSQVSWRKHVLEVTSGNKIMEMRSPPQCSQFFLYFESSLFPFQKRFSHCHLLWIDYVNRSRLVFYWKRKC